MEAQKKELSLTFIYFVVAALVVALAGSAYIGYRQRILAPEHLEAHTLNWLERPRAMARVFLDRYGPPSVLGPDVATWYERAPWKRIAIHGRSAGDFLEQAVGYRPRPAAAAAIQEFGEGVSVDLVREELSARSSSEALNFLALNLADDVAKGKRTPREAREVYLRTTKLAAAGKSSPYLDKLLFAPDPLVPQMRLPDMMGY